MDPARCIFAVKENLCVHRPHKDLHPILCYKHLMEIFGLEVDFDEQHEFPEGTFFTGPFVKPARCAAFATNDVILPLQLMVDSKMRPNDFVGKKRPIGLGNYRLNKYMERFIRLNSHHKGGMNEQRRMMFEVIRNWTETEQPNTGPNDDQKFLMTNLIARVSSVLSQCASAVRTNSNFSNYGRHKIMVYSEKDPTRKEAVSLDRLPVSPLMMFFLASCHQSVHTARFGQRDQYLHDYVFPNCAFVEDVGLVALERIARPLPLVVDGVSDGNQNFYELYVQNVERECDKKKVTPNDLRPTFFMENTFRGGSEKCY